MVDMTTSGGLGADDVLKLIFGSAYSSASSDAGKGLLYLQSFIDQGEL